MCPVELKVQRNHNSYQVMSSSHVVTTLHVIFHLIFKTGLGGQIY